MKKFIVFLMMFALLLACACGKEPVEPPVQPDPPLQEQPQTPEVPESPAAPESPEIPAEPETPEAPISTEPDGAVAMAQLPASIPDLDAADHIVPLEGNILALSGRHDSETYLVTYDMASSTVLSRLEVAGYDGTNTLELVEREPYGLLHYDGRDYWKVAVDDAWQFTREEYDPALNLSAMGDVMVSAFDGSIWVDGVAPPALQANDRMSYYFVRVLNDHQLLYQAMDRGIASLSHYGVYDSATGETRAVTTMGQSVVGNWGGILVIARNDNGWWYDFATVSLEDYTYTPLEIGHETAETGVNADNYGLNFIQCDEEGARMLLVWDKDGIRTVQVVELASGAELYRWKSSTEEGCTFFLAQDNSLVVQKGTADDSILWKVEY